MNKTERKKARPVGKIIYWLDVSKATKAQHKETAALDRSNVFAKVSSVGSGR